MKKIFTLALFTSGFFCCATLNAQNQVYCRDGFENNTFQTSAPLAGSAPYFATSDCGTYYALGAYSTTGTGCGAPYGARHIRFTTNITLPDSPYLVLPTTPQGIMELHFTRTRASRRFTIYKTTDTDPTTTNWVFAAFVPISTTTCLDSTIIIADPTTRHLKIVSRQGTDSDIDSVFQTSFTALPLAVNFYNTAAYQKNAGVQIDWSISNDNNASNYVVEKSGDGGTFTAIGNVNAQSIGTALATYSFFDANPFNGNNYYRIKGIDKDGSVKYTSIMKVSLGGGKADVVIAPNPVTSKQVILQMNNMSKGTYTANLYNIAGQNIYTYQIKTDGGSSSQTLQLPASVKTGTYNLQISNGADVKLNKTFIVE